MNFYKKRNQTTLFNVNTSDTLLAFIQKSLQGISRNKAKDILSGGGVTINKHRITQHDYPLVEGMTVEIRKHKGDEFRHQFVRIVYEDSHLFVVEKNAGILSMTNNSQAICVKTVLDTYLRKSRQRCTSHVVHRLDRETSGLMIYAKTHEAQNILEENWHGSVTDRRYIAVVEGAMTESEGKIESWLKDNKSYITYSSPTDNGGKYALTYFRTLKKNENYSLVELKLDTGRKNQIRVHLQDIGFPVVGDMKYGSGAGTIGRLALHAFRLNFYHPITQELMAFETPVPKLFKSLIS